MLRFGKKEIVEEVKAPTALKQKVIMKGAVFYETAKAHQEVAEHEDDNVGVQGVNETEGAGKSLALTPEGNLTLVDDVDRTIRAGKQFVTMVTKKGNYFYLVIDRDDKGKSTVHFLNQVDERDLFSLMDEDDSDYYDESGDDEPV